MRNTLVLLSILLLPAACKKQKQEQGTTAVTYYPQNYGVTYYSAKDSVVAGGSLARHSAYYYYDNVPVIMTMNGKEADTVISQNYIWRFKGLKDVAFNFSTHGKTLINTLQAADVKTYAFAGLPDTISIASWNNIEMNGPALSLGEEFVIQLYLPDNTTYSGVSTANTYVLPQSLLQHITPGTILCRVTWRGKVMNLQMSDNDAGGSMQWGSVIEKYIVLVP